VQKYWVETLGCPKNQVDSDKLIGSFERDGMVRASSPEEADLVVVNTCAFIDAAREESVDTVLQLSDQKREDAKIVVTGCMAERYGDELAAALPEVDQVSGFGVPIAPPAPKVLGVPISLGKKNTVPTLDLLNLPRPKSTVPWAYVKIAEGCNRNCGFCAIPSFRGKQRSRSVESILEEVEQLDAREIVLIAQDLAAYGVDENRRGAIVPLIKDVAKRTERVRLLYLYPSDLSDELIDTICETGVPYFDLSLQHVSKPLLRRMRRWGDAERFLKRVEDIRAREPQAAFRSNFIVGYPGETEDDHDALLRFVEEADMEWISFFSYSPEEGTYAMELDGEVPVEVMEERIRELRDLQDTITARKRASLIGEHVEVLVDAPGVGRSHREAPEIDGIIEVPDELPVGTFRKVEIVGAAGPDLEAR
jgi:ribosomal protein S12 methylthiotransferase